MTAAERRPILGGFVDRDSVPSADEELMIHYDESLDDLFLDDLVIHIDFTGSTFATGEERWATDFAVAWSGGGRDVSVTASIRSDDQAEADERLILSTQTLRIEPGAGLEVVPTPDGGIAVRLS